MRTKLQTARGYLFYLLALLLLSLLQDCTQPPDTAEGKIAYLYHDFRNEEEGRIFVMNADGSDAHQLQTNMTEDGCPHWSPDGKRLIFVSANGRDLSESDLYTINFDGTGLIRLTVGRYVFDASISPDGTKIAFTARTGNAANLFVMDANGENIVQLTDQITIDQTPAWLDDQTILFSSNRGDRERAQNENWDIYSIAMDGKQLTRLTDSIESDYLFNPPKDYAPDLSVNDQIAFHTQQLFDPEAQDFSGIEYISVMNTDGSNPHTLTQPDKTSLNSDPAWSPDGEYIVFVSDRDHRDEGVLNTDIYKMRRDGSDVTRLTTSGHAMCPDWSP